MGSEGRGPGMQCLAAQAIPPSWLNGKIRAVCGCQGPAGELTARRGVLSVSQSVLT